MIGASDGAMHMIAISGKKHPNWKDARYAFGSEDSNHFLRISDVHLNDAGKFFCGSDSPTTFIVSLLR